MGQSVSYLDALTSFCLKWISTFFVKGQVVNILGFAGQTVSAVATQFCLCVCMKAAIDKCKQMSVAVLQ